MLFRSVFLTGSDTSANALFGSLQASTAHQIGVTPELTVAANTTGGVTGKMISPQSIAIACASVGLEGLVPLLTHPLIHIDDLHELLGREQVDNLLASGLLLPTTEPDLYQLSYTSQQNYERAEVIEAVGGVEVATALSSLCTKTTLIEDPYTGGYHPRIAWERSRLYGHWDETLQSRWMELSHDYYYQRHDELFRATGLHRLSSLARHSGILLCAEDLGMISAEIGRASCRERV